MPRRWLAGSRVVRSSEGRSPGGSGAGLGAATATATTFVSEQARTALGEKTGIPDPLLGVVEDALAVGVAAVASRSRDGEATDRARAERKGPPRSSPLSAAAGAAYRAFGG